ncbi:YcaO-like family protein [bacterium]|nr:YcaO-like family protein [bacterium]MBU1433574.1 YcaO-like family protein [bacterium]MBU1503245.1 YcaO-like family protein [bacterium]
MNILSKDAPLEESLKKMRSVLESVGCEVTFSEEKHPLQNCYSVNLASKEAPKHIYSNGKGTLSEASMASALGEYIERLQTNNFFIDFHLPNRKYYPDEVAFDFGGEYLSAELLSIYDPNAELSDEDLVDYNSDYEDKIVSLPFVKHSTGEQIYFPINILSNLYVSNGLATGNTPQEAQVQALSEIYERYAKMQIIKNGYALPKFPDELVNSFTKLSHDVGALRDLGYIIEVLDASLGGEFPVTAISLINPKNATLFVSFGAHPILEVSLERTMTELMQGRGLENLDGFETPTFDLSLVADNFNLESHFIDSNGKLGFHFLSSKKSFPYTPWRYDGSCTEDEHAFLIGIARDLEHEIYLREYDYLGFYSCQMLIPGISEVYPIDDLIYNNKNTPKRIRDMVLNFKEYDPEDILTEIESLEDSLNMEKYIGVIFAQNFTMREFKAQVHLMLRNSEEVFELLEFGQDKLGHIVLELMRMDANDMLLEEFEEGLNAIYTEARVQKALAILDGDDYLIDVTLHQDYRNMLAMYDRLELKKRSKNSCPKGAKL